MNRPPILGNVGLQDSWEAIECTEGDFESAEQILRRFVVPSRNSTF